MSDIDYLIQITAKLRDEASAKVAALKAELDKLKGTRDIENAQSDLGDSIKDTGDEAEKAEPKHRKNREEQEKNRRASEDAKKGASDLGDAVDDLGRSHDKSADSMSAHRTEQKQFNEELKKGRKNTKDTADGLDELDQRMKSLITRRDELNQKSLLPNDVDGLNKQREAYADLDRQIKSISNSYSRFATARKEGEDSLRTDAIKKAEQGFAEAAQAHAEADRLQKLVPASRQPTTVDTASAARRVKQAEDEANAQKDLELSLSRTRAAYSDFENDLNKGNLSKGEAKKGLQEFSGEFSNLSKKLETGGQDWKDTEQTLDRISNKLKNPDLASTGGLARASLRTITGSGDQSRKSSAGEALEAIDSKIGDVGIRISGVASALQGFFDLAKIGLSQQLITGVISLAGGLVSVASAATQAGAALAGAFVSGVGQAIPMLSIVAAAVERFKTILQAVSVAGQAEQQHYYDPTEKQVTQLQNNNQLISSQQQLANSYIQLSEAQQRVRDSQIQLTEARYTAQRQITELANAEKDARLEAEGANLSLAESRRQLEIQIQRGGSGGASLQQAELAVKEAELNKEKANYAVPKAAREATLARQRGVSGAPSVISASEGLEGAQVAVTQARQAGEAAKRQEEITKLQQQARSTKETTYESQEKFLKKGMSPTELGLTDSLIGLEKELKSPGSPIQKIADYLVEPVAGAVKRIRSLLKSSNFLEPIDALAKSMGNGLKKLENFTFGEQGTSFFETMSKDATKNVPIVTSAIEGLMKLFEDVAKAADPAFETMSKDWDKFISSLNKKYEGNGLEKLAEFFNKSVKYAESFAKLGIALFGLFKSIGSDAAPQGLDTVNSFTGSIEKATKWIQEHEHEVINFFKEAREGLSVLGELAFGVGTNLIKIFDVESLKSFSSFLTQILLPAMRLVVEGLGKITTALIEIANAIPGGKDILIALATAFIAVAGISKAYEPIMKVVTAFKALHAASKAIAAGQGIKGAWEAMAAVFDNVGKKASYAKDEVSELAGVEGASVAPAEADAGAQAEVAAAEGAGGAGGVGLLGSLGIGALGIGRGTIADRATSGLGQSSYHGIPTSGSFFQEQGRAVHHQIENIDPTKNPASAGLNLVGDLTGVSNLTEKIFGGPNGSEEKLRAFGNEVQKLEKHLTTLPKQKLESIQHEAESLAQNPALEKYKGNLETMAKAFTPSEVAAKKWSERIQEYMSHLSPAAKNIAETFQSINTTSGSIWKNISSVVKENTQNIKENLGLNSKQGKEALSASFDEATIKVEESMKKQSMSVKIGTERIKQLVSEQLKTFGVKPAEVLNAGNAAAGIAGAAAKAIPKLAAGAYVTAQSGGVMANIGEDRHDEVVLSTDPAHASRSRALLGKYLSRAPHMASGGFVADPGTNFTVNQEPKIVTELRKLGEYLNTTIYGISGYRSPQHSAEVGGFSDDPHTRGEAADIGVGSDSRESAGRLNAGMLAKFDLYRPFYPASAAEINHVQLIPGDVAGIAGSSAGSGLPGAVGSAAQAIHKIISPKIKGGGEIGQIAQAALNISTKAANIFLQKHAESSGEPGSSFGSIGTNWSGTWVKVMEQIAKAKNWSLSAWKGVVSDESGGNPNARNPSSGAYGLGQFLGSTLTEYAKYGATSSNPVKQIEAMAQYISDRYGNPSAALAHENANHWYAKGGVIESLRAFAAGGRAPWGGRPVPIIAHEGERIMNPAQYGETARLAGTSPSGLDKHLGYDGSPRQSFADGGIPRYKSQSAQKTTGSPSFPLVSIEKELAEYVPDLVNPGSTESVKKITKIFKSISEAFKKLKLVGKNNEKYSTEIAKFVASIVEETTGILSKLKENQETVRAKFNAKKIQTGYAPVVGGTRGGVKFKSTSLEAIENQKIIKMNKGGESAIEQAEIRALTNEGKELSQQSKLNSTTLSKVKSGLVAASKIKNTSKRTATVDALKEQYDKLITSQKELSEAMATNIESRYQAEAQALQDKLTESNSAYQNVSSKLSGESSIASSMGNYGEVGSISKNIANVASTQIKSLEPMLNKAKSIGDTELVNSIEQELTTLKQTIANSVIEYLGSVQSAINQKSQATEATESSRQSIAQAYGKLELSSVIEESIKQTAEVKYHELGSLLENAEGAGDSALVATIKSEMASLETTIFTAAANQITNAQSLIQRESQLAESKSSARLSMSKIIAAEATGIGGLEAAGREEKFGLTEKQTNLHSTIAQEEQLKEKALQEGDTTAVISLTEEIEKNNVELAENNLALKENAVITRELIVSQIQAEGQFKTGIYSAATTGLEILSKTTGYNNVGALLASAKGKGQALGTERSELEGQATGIGLGVNGMSPAEILTYLASPSGQNKLSEMEKGEDKGEKESMYKLIDALETNATNTLKNSEEIAKLNGQLNQPQSWSTTAWQQFRGAVFNGMGGLNASYSSALPPGAVPTEMPVYGSQAPGASQAPTIGNLSLTHPVEKLDPALLGEELSHHLATDPSM